jgi:DNA-binding NarL/FixJ family response regulator
MLANQRQPSFAPFAGTSTEALSVQYRMLIASGHGLLREALRDALESHPECLSVAEAECLSQVERACEQRAVDIVLLDWDLAEQASIPFLQTPAVAGAGVPVLILASPTQRVRAERLLRAGAAGLVWDQTGIQDLRLGIREAMKRKTWRDCRTLRPRTPNQTPVQPWGEFTERQKKVAQGVLRGRTNKEIASCLAVSETSVKCTMRQLFAKTETRSRTHLAMLLLEQLPIDRFRELS